MDFFPILKDRINQSAGTMSGGEQEILVIGRALMSNLKILLLDEPSLRPAPVLMNKVMEMVKLINESQDVTVPLVEKMPIQSLSWQTVDMCWEMVSLQCTAIPKTFEKTFKEISEQSYKVSTCNVSYAMDKLSFACRIYGIKPTYDCPKVVGLAITMRVMAYGENNPPGHMEVDPLSVSEEGDVIVIDNNGHLDQNCWGEIMTYSAQQISVAGVIIDGATRDVELLRKQISLSMPEE
jgi:hypothetical protein